MVTSEQPESTGTLSVICLCWTSLGQALLCTTVAFESQSAKKYLYSYTTCHNAVVRLVSTLFHSIVKPSFSEQEYASHMKTELQGGHGCAKPADEALCWTDTSHLSEANTIGAVV